VDTDSQKYSIKCRTTSRTHPRTHLSSAATHGGFDRALTFENLVCQGGGRLRLRSRSLPGPCRGCSHLSVCLYLYVCMHTWTCVDVCVRLSLSLSLSLSLCVCVCVMYVHTSCVCAYVRDVCAFVLRRLPGPCLICIHCVCASVCVCVCARARLNMYAHAHKRSGVCAHKCRGGGGGVARRRRRRRRNPSSCINIVEYTHKNINAAEEEEEA